VIDPPDVSDRVMAGRESHSLARRLSVGLLAVVVIVSTVILGYGLVRVFSGKGEPAFQSARNGKIAFVAQGEGRGLTQPVHHHIFLMSPDGTGLLNTTALPLRLRSRLGPVHSAGMVSLPPPQGILGPSGRAYPPSLFVRLRGVLKLRAAPDNISTVDTPRASRAGGNE
jgi:hypothetical protein